MPFSRTDIPTEQIDSREQFAVSKSKKQNFIFFILAKKIGGHKFFIYLKKVLAGVHKPVFLSTDNQK